MLNYVSQCDSKLAGNKMQSELTDFALALPPINLDRMSPLILAHLLHYLIM